LFSTFNDLQFKTLGIYQHAMLLTSLLLPMPKPIQNDLFQRALDYRQNHITEVNSFEEFKEVLENKSGFISAHWDGTPETEEKVKDLTKATIRCIPLDRIESEGKCIFSGGKSTGRVLFAKAY
jgi:prolyl-tRNA synthetase